MKEKYTRVTINILLCIPIALAVFFIDQWLLPQNTINDELVAYSRIYISKGSSQYSNKSSKEFVGYKFYTQKGLEFSTDKAYIEEYEVIIKHSYIFKSITTVKSQTKDYSDKIISGLHGACLYFTIFLEIVAIISLLLLKYNDQLSENGFYNIILFNSFLLIVSLYVYVLYN